MVIRQKSHAPTPVFNPPPERLLRGKLTRQEADDVSAEELLKGIVLERTKFSARNKSKLPPALEPDAKNIPYELPKNWAWASVGQLSLLITDGTHHTPKYVNSGVPFISVKDISGGRLDFSNTRFISEAEHREINARCNPERNDILICRIGTLGSPVLVDTDKPFSLFVSVGLIKFPSRHVVPEYFLLVLRSPVLEAQYDDIKAGGSHTNKLNLGDLPRLLVPLPPLAEQKRIVAKVEQLMALCDELEAKQAKKSEVGNSLTKAALAALESAETPEEFKFAWQRVAENFTNLFDSAAVIADLREALLDLAMKGLLVRQETADGTAQPIVDALPSKKSALAKRLAVRQGDAQEAGVPEDEQPHAIPSSWRWVRLSALGCFMGGGTPSKANPEFWKGSIPWVSPKDMKRPFIADAEDHISRAALDSSAAKLIPSPSLLMVLRGMILAHSFPVAVTERDVAVNQDMRALVFADASLAPFVLRACQAARARVLARVERSSHGTCRLDSEIAESLPIPLPPVSEQKRIVARLEQVTALCNDLEARLLVRDTRAEKLADALSRTSAAASER